MYRITAVVLVSPSSVDIVLTYVLRTFLLLSILVCPSHLCSLAVVLWGFCHAVVSEPRWLEGSAGSALSVTGVVEGAES